MKNLIKKILRESDFDWVSGVREATHVDIDFNPLQPNDIVEVVDESTAYYGEILTIEHLLSDEETGYDIMKCKGVFTTYEHDTTYFCGAEVRKLEQKINESDFDWVGDIDASGDLRNTIFYSESGTGLYDDWSVGREIYKILNKGGVRWNNGDKIKDSDDYRLLDRYYMVVKSDNRLIYGAPGKKFDPDNYHHTDSMYYQDTKNFTIINVDEKFN